MAQKQATQIEDLFATEGSKLMGSSKFDFWHNIAHI